MLLLAWDDLPQISQIYTDGLSAKDLPQIEQNSQNILLGMTSHGLLLLAGDNLPQIAQIYTDGLSAKDPPTD